MDQETMDLLARTAFQQNAVMVCSLASVAVFMALAILMINRTHKIVISLGIITLVALLYGAVHYNIVGTEGNITANEKIRQTAIDKYGLDNIDYGRYHSFAQERKNDAVLTVDGNPRDGWVYLTENGEVEIGFNDPNAVPSPQELMNRAPESRKQTDAQQC